MRTTLPKPASILKPAASPKPAYIAKPASGPKRASILAVMAAAALTLVLAMACGGDGGEPETGKLRVATSVSPITNIVENIGGNRIILTGVVPEGVNSHTFEPQPSVARVIAAADLIILNGLFLEEPFLAMAEANKRDGAVILTLGDKAVSRENWVYDFSFPETDGHPNPHLWTSPVMAQRYAALVRDQLVEMDPDNAAYYRENHDRFFDRLTDLDARIARAAATAPAQNRKLLTYHDSFPYFAPRYGFEIIGAVQPSDFSQPSAREVADLIEQVRSTGVPAIFGSKAFPSDVMEQIAREGGARFVDKLRDDDLPGGPGDPDHSYVGLMAANVRAIVTALGGEASALDGLDTGPVFTGPSGAVYPQ